MYLHSRLPRVSSGGGLYAPRRAPTSPASSSTALAKASRSTSLPTSTADLRSTIFPIMAIYWPMLRFAAGDSLPVHISGRGLLDCELYEQSGRLILHIVNLTSAGTWRAPVEELIPVGPLKVKVRLPHGIAPKSARALVSEEDKPITIEDGWARF